MKRAMRQKITLLAILILFSFSIYAQKPLRLELSLPQKIADDVSLFTTDIFGNVLFVNSKNELKKIDSKQKLVGVYSRRINSTLKIVDVSNPMKIMVYYPDLLELSVLDNFLSPLFELSFQQYADAGPLKLICQSTENGFWIYDELNRTLKNVNENLDLTRSSGDLYQLLSYLPIPTKINSYKNQQYLYDTKHGILMFDEFGTYIKTIPITGVSDFQVREDEILFTKEKSLLSYNPLTFTIDTLYDFSLLDLQSVRRENNNLYVLAGKELFLYSIIVK